MIKFSLKNQKSNEKTCPIVIEEGPFKGVVFQYGTIGFPEGVDENTPDASATMTIEYDVVEIPDCMNKTKNQIETDENFTELIKKLTVDLLEDFCEREINKENASSDKSK